MQLHIEACLVLVIAVSLLENVACQNANEDCVAVRIAGRDNILAKDGGFPYMVSIKRIWNLNNGTSIEVHHCGGSIINERWVLTAAHCVYMIPKSMFRIISGIINLKEPGTIHYIENIEVHKDYNSQNTLSDIALMRVQNPFVWSNQPLVRHIPLNSNPWLELKKGVISGWGLTGKDGTISSNNLQYLEEEITTLEECQKEHYPIPIYVSHICGKAKDCSGACGGDSGSPFIWNGVQIGVASWIRHPCGQHPDVYVSVAHFIGWIRYTVLKYASKSNY